MSNIIAGKSLLEWQQEYPVLNKIMAMEDVLWVNPVYRPWESKKASWGLDEKDIDGAEQRLLRFAPYIAKVFPETAAANGIIESPLCKILIMKNSLENIYQAKISGNIYLKCDSHLPISGSVKARGGVYEVLRFAEDIAIQHKLLDTTEDYAKLDSELFRQLFSQYTLVVGSTGNLGLSIGIIGRALGFKVTVHMSVDAKKWKKEILKSKGVTVIEHSADYSKAVEAGRKQAATDDQSYFIDDENSRQLFLGYAVAARRLKNQLDALQIQVDDNHPLFVYLPCGVGGSPGGLAFGLKTVFKDNVHCFFAEPTHSPAMLLGLLTAKHDEISVQDFGIDNITAADGLACGRPSGFVGKILASDISGVLTVADDELYLLLNMLADAENIYLEPSALAGFPGPMKLLSEQAGLNYLEQRSLIGKMDTASHVLWATGGSMVPRDIMNSFYEKGANVIIPG